MKISETIILKTARTALAAGLFCPAFVTVRADEPTAAAPAVPASHSQPVAPPGGAGAGRAINLPKSPMVMFRVELDENQNQLLNESLGKHSEQLRDLEKQERAVSLELAHAVLAQKQDEKLIQEKADTVAKLSTQATVLRAKVFSVVVPTLSPEQRKKMESTPYYWAMMTQLPPVRPEGPKPTVPPSAPK